MWKLLQRSLAIGILCLILAAQLSEADTEPSSHSIKPRRVRDFVGALVQLRRFLSNRLNAEQRCQRQAVVLSAMKNEPIDPLEISNIGVGLDEEVARRFEQIDLEQLRNLYIAVGHQYLERQHVDDSLIELVDCLTSGYWNRDARARSFLNDPELNRLIAQLQMLSKQPLRLLMGNTSPRKRLDMNKFDDSIERTASNWIGGDPQNFSERLRNQPVIMPQHIEYEYPQIGAPVQYTQRVPFQSAISQVIPSYEQIDQRVDDETAAAMAAAITPMALPPAPIPTNLMPALRKTDPEADEDLEYLETVFGSLMTIYESLPAQAQLADRCQAYGRLITANRRQVFRDDFLNKLISQVSARVLSQSRRRSVFRPDKKTREDFLFIVEMFEPLRAGPEVWLDLNDCMSVWANVDQNVAQYLNSPEHYELVNRVNSQFEDGDAPVYTTADATFY